MTAILGKETATRLRFGAFTTVDHEQVRGAITQTTFRGSFQPFKGKIQSADELYSTDGMLNLFTKLDLRTADDTQNCPADEVIYNDLRYRVIEVNRWPKLLSHWHVILDKIGPAYEGLEVELQAGLQA